MAPTEVSFFETSEILSELRLIWSERSVSHSSTPASSQDIETPREDGDEVDEVELPSLSSLLKIGPSSLSPGFCSEMAQEGLYEPVLGGSRAG
jgi:hypothetical protein